MLIEFGREDTKNKSFGKIFDKKLKSENGELRTEN